LMTIVTYHQAEFLQGFSAESSSEYLLFNAKKMSISVYCIQYDI